MIRSPLYLLALLACHADAGTGPGPVPQLRPPARRRADCSLAAHPSLSAAVPVLLQLRPVRVQLHAQPPELEPVQLSAAGPRLLRGRYLHVGLFAAVRAAVRRPDLVQQLPAGYSPLDARTETPRPRR